MLTLDEEDELEREHLALERAGAQRHAVGVCARGYVHAVHPDHGEPVVFVPGEMLPSWAVDVA